MKNTLKGLLLSSTFALAACGGQKQDMEDLPVIKTNVMLEEGAEKAMDLNRFAVERCEKLYGERGVSGKNVCAVTMLMENPETERVTEYFTLAAKCDTHTSLLGFNDPFNGKPDCRLTISTQNTVRRAPGIRGPGEAL